MDLLPVPEDVAVVWQIDAGDALREYGLAGAVVTAQRRDLAGGKIQVDAVQGLHRTEVLVKTANLEQRLRNLRHLYQFCSEKRDAAAPTARRHLSMVVPDYVMPLALQTLAPTALHRAVLSTKLSLMTVAATLDLSTHSGVKRTAG